MRFAAQLRAFQSFFLTLFLLVEPSPCKESLEYHADLSHNENDTA